MKTKSHHSFLENGFQNSVIDSTSTVNPLEYLSVEVESGWILVDCGGVVVNIMKAETRDFYDLEGLWGENTLLNTSG